MKIRIKILFPALFTVLALGSAQGAPKPNSLDSQWVIMGNDGKLKYKTTPRGDRIMDYSHAGYMGGGVAIPTVPAKITLSPTPSGDDSDRIQAAIDKVSKMRLVGNFRGAVLLKPGKYRCDKRLTIMASGVVLRGSGKGKDGSVISLTGKPHSCLRVGGEQYELKLGDPTLITDNYVPSGTDKISVKSISGLSVGDRVMLRSTITKERIAFLGMDKLVRNKKKQNWLNPGSKLSFERTITGIKGKVLTLDIGLSDSVDANFTKADPTTVQKILSLERLSHIGVENLRIAGTPPVGNLRKPHCGGIGFKAVENCWVRNVYTDDAVTVVSCDGNSTRLTFQGVDGYHSKPVERGAGHPASFSVSGSFVLLDRCTINNGKAYTFYYTSHGLRESAAVLLNCTFEGGGSVMPHMRWNTGLLVDSCKVPKGAIQLVSRGNAGSGHGWTIGWPVAWNCIAERLESHIPPGTVSWMIGCKGRIDTKEAKRHRVHRKLIGNYLSHGTHVDPSSLYLAQLRERLGEAAVKNMGY